MTDLDKMLKFDGLAAAEHLTGADYKTDKATEALGFALIMANAERKRVALETAGDTTFSNALARYQAVITGAGYELAYAEPFESRGRAEQLFIYAHRDGLLLHFDTYSGDRVNGGKVHYNWRPADIENRWGLTSSGHYSNYDDPENRVWVGDHDCREGLLHNIQRLRENGALLSPWAEQPSCFWLAHYRDWDDCPEDHRERVAIINARTAARLRKCPEWVRDMVLFRDSDEHRNGEDREDGLSGEAMPARARRASPEPARKDPS